MGIDQFENSESSNGLEKSLDVHLEAHRREIAAFEKMLPRLMVAYGDGHYVAILKGEVIDNDSDKKALMDRTYFDYPKDYVLVRKVTYESPPVSYIDELCQKA